MVTVEELRKWYETHRETILENYFSLLRFKSISADPAFTDEMGRCALWISDYLKNLGMDVELWETSGHPVVFGSTSYDPSKPTVLIYHHYDVQPVDPLELWKSDPFDPEVRDGKVYARGASDNKGQLGFTLTALKAFLGLAKGKEINIKIFVEGEEESGGSGTFEILEKKKEALKADYLLVVDMDLPAQDVPGITLGLRGILALEVECKNSLSDLHSGTHGGIALNPNRALASALGKLWDENGSVAIPHFYDEVMPLSKEELNRLDTSFDKGKYTKEFGVQAFSGETGFSFVESNWARPTLEINGMSGGYTGAGFKTIIPSIAKAKISCRLVPSQDPHTIALRIKEFLRKHIPEGISLKIEELHGAAAYRCPFDSSLVITVAKAYEEVFNKKCNYMLCGGSVPIVPALASASGAMTALIGCALATDDIHAPNEHFGLDRFEQGFLTIGRILSLLGVK